MKPEAWTRLNCSLWPIMPTCSINYTGKQSITRMCKMKGAGVNCQPSMLFPVKYELMAHHWLLQIWISMKSMTMSTNLQLCQWNPQPIGQFQTRITLKENVIYLIFVKIWPFDSLMCFYTHVLIYMMHFQKHESQNWGVLMNFDG